MTEQKKEGFKLKYLFNGWLTYISGTASIITGLYCMATNGCGTIDGWQLVVLGLGLLGLRRAINEIK